MQYRDIVTQVHVRTAEEDNLANNLQHKIRGKNIV